MTSGDDAHDFARLALAETGDAIKVLSKRAQAKNLEPGILSARANVTAAAVLPQVAQHTPRFDNVFEQAIGGLRMARSDLANPDSLPASFPK